MTLHNFTTGTITPKPVTVAATTDSKTYDGTTSSSATPTISPALIAPDTTTALSQAFQNKNAGSGNKVLVPSITIKDGNSCANYSVTLQNFTTGTITARHIEVTAAAHTTA